MKKATYTKYCPNVFVAMTAEELQKGEIILMRTKYGREHEAIVFNHLGVKNGQNLYSVVRADGFDHKEFIKRKAERLKASALRHEAKANEWYEKSKEGADFLRLAEPIKVGHHSEKSHRALIERNWNRMGNSVKESEIAEKFASRAAYWAERADKINLSMPESLEFFEFELEKAKKEHQHLKDNPEARAHSMALQYANKKVKELENNLNLAVRLWGDDEVIQQIDREKKEKAEKQAQKSNKMQDIIKKYGGFFAFNTEQFKEGYNKTKEAFNLEEGEKVTNFGKGLYVPSRFKDEFLKEYRG